MTSRIRVAVARPRGWLDVIGLIAAAVLLGALAFGLWHLVVGELISGNPRAGAFGAGLALAAGIALLVGLRVIRARRQARRSAGR